MNKQPSERIQNSNPVRPYGVLKPNAHNCAIERIVNFFISTDSVVAKATIVIDDETRRIELDWGDGTVDVINHRPGFPVLAQPVMGSSPLPSGTYEIFHRYDVLYTSSPGTDTGDRPTPQEHVAALRVDDADGSVDFDTERFIITPKYRVTHYPMFVWIDDTCDAFWDPAHDFSIIQTIEGDVIHSWSWTPSNSFFGKSQGILLEGSQFSREYDIPPYFVYDQIQTRFDFTEDDLHWDDKVRVGVTMRLYHSNDEEIFSDRIEGEASGDGCTIHYAYTKEVQLLVPLPRDSSTVFSE